MEMKNKQQTENKENNKNQNNMPSAKEQYNIILKLYKGLHENLEELYKKSKDKKSSTKASQLAYKVDRIVSGLHLTLNFEDENQQAYLLLQVLRMCQNFYKFLLVLASFLLQFLLKQLHLLLLLQHLHPFLFSLKLFD